MRLFLALLLTAVSAAASSGPGLTLPDLDLNDVSILFPLPKADAWSALPQASSAGMHGVLLPADYVNRLPMLLQGVKNSVLYPDLRAVGLRVDPCFMEGLAPVRCQPQIRMIWQPLILVNGKTSTLDVTLHSFYRLKAEEFAALVTELKNLKQSLAEPAPEPAALGVHPRLLAEGPDGNFARKLLSILYRYTGRGNLSRITFMQLFGRETVWIFGGVDIQGGKFTAIGIPRLEPGKNTLQQFTNLVLPDPAWFRGGLFPAPESGENLNILIEDSRKLAPEHEEEIIAAVRSAFRFENPRLHNPGTVDCVSCHAAQPARAWAVRQYPWLNLEQTNADSIYYDSANNLRNLSPLQDRTNIVRMFGYFADQPFVAQRVINESAEVVNYLRRNY